jgi:H+-translocating NAD(P) transhydrogenase subunit alpha
MSNRAEPSRRGATLKIVALTAALLAPGPAFAAGIGGPIEPVIYELMVFAMAIFVGYYVVWSVTPALHTPLMSVTNAISSVIVVGALLAVAVEHGGMDSFANLDGSLASKIFGLLALAMAAVNIFGGFLVTQRMLSMYKKKGDKR